VKTVADRHRHTVIITSTNDELLMVSTSMTLNVLEPFKCGVFSVLKLFLQFSTVTHISKVNCTDMARDNLQTGYANAVAHLMAFAQITCV